MGVVCRPIERIWCCVKNPIAEQRVTEGEITELMRRLTDNFQNLVTDKVLAGSLRRTMEQEDVYLTHVPDENGVTQAPEADESDDSDEETEPEDLEASLAEDSDDEDE